MHISEIQFITNFQSKISHVEQVKQVVNGGIKWIQYRPKINDLSKILEEGREIAELCKQHSVTFIVNDNVDLALELNADGVHLGKSDMSPEEARKILGEDKIIGGTANTFVDIVTLINEGVNYVGLGPYSFTETKKNLSPVLGIEGYKEIFNTLKERNIEIPIIAIGGIKLRDIIALQNIGAHGIAISSLLSESDDVVTTTKDLLEVSH